MKVYIEESVLVFRYIAAVAVGMLLGATLVSFIISEDCRKYGFSNLAGKIYCSERYGETLRE